MKWYTIIGTGPLVEAVPAIVQAPDGGYIVWDGPARKQTAVAAAWRATHFFERVRLFTGKEIGRLVDTYAN